MRGTGREGSRRGGMREEGVGGKAAVRWKNRLFERIVNTFLKMKVFFLLCFVHFSRFFYCELLVFGWDAVCDTKERDISAGVASVG